MVKYILWANFADCIMEFPSRIHGSATSAEKCHCDTHRERSKSRSGASGIRLIDYKNPFQPPL